MSLNSEPVPEEHDLLSLIDAGIAALREEGGAPLTVDAGQVKQSEQKK